MSKLSVLGSVGTLVWGAMWDKFSFGRSGKLNISLCFLAPANVNLNAVQISFDVARY